MPLHPGPLKPIVKRIKYPFHNLNPDHFIGGAVAETASSTGLHNSI